MLSRTKDFIKINDFQVSTVSVVLWLDVQLKLIILALTFSKSICVIWLRSAETSLMLWLYGKDSIKRAAFLALADILHKSN